MTPTLGAVLAGFAFLVWELCSWYPGTKALRTNLVGCLGSLLPFVLCWCVGAQTGTAPGSTSAPLTQGGLLMTALVLAGFLARRKRGATGSKWRGWCSGIGLALSAGVARYAAIPLASAVNLSGAWLTGVVS